MRVVIFLSAILAVILLVAALPMSGQAEAGPTSHGQRIVRSAHDVKRTVAALENALRRRGVETKVTIANARDQDRNETLVLFADPNRVGPNQSVELKLSALVYGEGDGSAISFDDEHGLARRAGLGEDEAAYAGRVVATAVTEAASY